MRARAERANEQDVDADESEPETVVKRSRRRWLWRGLIVLLVVVLAALLIAWTQRRSIAGDFVQRELTRRGVQGSYEIAAIGWRTQRIEKIVLGDPRNPDLTADWAEIVTRIGLSGPVVTGVRAHGVRLRGRLIGGTFSFGQVDRLLPPPSGKPFALPDLDVVLSDARMRLDLPGGPIGLKLEGNGNLSDGFAGKLAAVAPGLAIGDCRLSGMSAWLDLRVAARAPRVAGPVRAERFGCTGGLALDSAQALVDVALVEALDRWNGSARLTLGEGRLDANRLSGVTGRMTFAGSARQTKGALDIAAARLAAAGVTGSGLRLEGAYRLDGGDELTLGLGGKAALARASLDARALAAATAFGGATNGLPTEPLLRALAEATRRAGRDAAAAADFTLAQRGSVGSLQLSALEINARSGARMALSGDGVRYTWPGGAGVQVDGALALSGGGFPATRVALDQSRPGAPVSGTATIAPYAAGGARLALSPVRFGPSGGVTRFTTRAELTGPLPDGRVTALTLPIDGRIARDGSLVVNAACAPLGFRSLSIAGLELGASRATLCPEDGGLVTRRNGRLGGAARLVNPRFTGRLGGSPVALAAASARYRLGDGRIDASDLAIRLGPADAVTRLDIAGLNGTLRSGTITGRFAGLGGQIAKVPLIVSDSAGSWSFGRGRLAASGSLAVADDNPAPRFAPLVSRDFALTFADSRIAASGLLVEPKANAAVTQVRIAHDLSRGSGNAVLDVERLEFGEAFQPDQLTRLALGVVANVRGVVTGQGNIRWTRDGVTSDGVFRTENTDLAAAFGPVTGLSTELRFTDLLGLETAPGQRATLGAVNPGLAVLDGLIEYRLLPGQRVQVEGGRWPFAGGELILEPATLDFAAPSERRLTFRVAGVDIAQFVNEVDLKDISATGILDGVIPMVFDANGGRIEGGRLAVRPGGGTLAYVGEVSNAELGIWGDIAFDALKSIAYRDLTISLDGDIDGEMVSAVKFTGVSRGTIEPIATGLIATIGGQVATQVQRLPFTFNIRITAPFRQLLNTAQGLYDPKVMIERNLPELIRQQRGPEQNRGIEPGRETVQPPASEDRP